MPPPSSRPSWPASKSATVELESTVGTSPTAMSPWQSVSASAPLPACDDAAPLGKRYGRALKPLATQQPALLREKAPHTVLPFELPLLPPLAARPMSPLRLAPSPREAAIAIDTKRSPAADTADPNGPPATQPRLTRSTHGSSNHAPTRRKKAVEQLRKAARRVVGKRWFEGLAFVLIGANCVTLAMYRPSDTTCASSRCQILEVSVGQSWGRRAGIGTCRRLD